MRKEKTDYKEINISLKKIQDYKFYYNLDFSVTKKKIEEGMLPYNVTIKYNISYNLEENFFYLNLSISYDDNNILILEAENRFTFQIKDLKSLIKIQSDKSFSLEVDFLPMIINIAIGTMRGIIYYRTSSTPLSEFPLPMISLNELANNTLSNSHD